MLENNSDSTWIRSGAVALALSGVLFAGFPLVRPFFDDLSRDPTGAATTTASPTWFISHLMLILALVLLPLGLLAAATQYEPIPGTGVLGAVLTLAGAGLFLPVAGVEAFALPAIAGLYLQGNTAALTAVDVAHKGLQTSVFAPALVLLGLGGIFTAIGVVRSHSYPAWPAVALAVGLISFMPLLPQPVRIADGLVIGVGAVGLARGVWQHGSSAAPRLGRRVPSGVLAK
jgi:hypothetical protein